MIRFSKHHAFDLLPTMVTLLSLAGCTNLSGRFEDTLAPATAATTAAADVAPAGKAVVETGDDTATKAADTAKIRRGTGVLVNPPKLPKASSGGTISLSFEAADVRDIAKTVLAEILKESYIVDPKVGGTISFRTSKPLAREDLLPTLETILRMNGIVMIKENGIFKIMPTAAARGSLSPSMGTARAGFSLQVVPLRFVGVREMAKILENIAPDPSLIKTDELRNLLILAGTQNEIGHMLDTVEMFDVDWLSGMSIGLFTLQSTDVKTLDKELSAIFGDKALNPLAGVVKFVPIERLNGFVIISPQPHYLEQAKFWLERLDKVGGTGGSRLYVYHVQNGKAENIAELLNQTFGSRQQTPTTTTRTPTPPRVAPNLTGTQLRSSLNANSTSAATGTAITGTNATTLSSTPAVGATLSITDDSGSATEVRVVADKENNALLILANAAGYEKIESALKKMDVVPRQVLIEVTIAEVTLKDELSYGVEWLFTNGSRRSGKLDLGTPGLNQLVPGFSYAITSVAGDTIKGVLNALATDNKVNILSSPHIMVADNQTAKIQVGDSVPIAGPQTVTGTGNVVSSVQYLDTGIIMSVVPHINAGGLVNLEITQEVSTASNTTTSGLNSPTISKRTTNTIVSVQSGETMVMGGLISEQTDVGSAGLPFLSSIPILGGLFGNQTRNTTKTELIVLITPRVANNIGQGKQISDELRRKMKETEYLLDCGTSNVVGMTTRGGLWCLQARRFDGPTDRMLLEGEGGVPVYLKDEAKRAQEAAERSFAEAQRIYDDAQARLRETSARMQETHRSPAPVSAPTPVPVPAPIATPVPAPAAAPTVPPAH